MAEFYPMYSLIPMLLAHPIMVDSMRAYQEQTGQSDDAVYLHFWADQMKHYYPEQAEEIDAAVVQRLAAESEQ